MKQIGEPKRVTANNAQGHTVTTVHTVLEIEESDIGRVMENHRGYRHSYHMVKRSDVGRQITRYTDGTEWTCWMFNQ